MLPFSDCTSKAVVIVQSSTDFGGIAQPNCTSNGVVISDSAAANTGSVGSVVLVTVCDPRDFGSKLPMFNGANAAFLTQASAAFRAEPYN